MTIDAALAITPRFSSPLYLALTLLALIVSAIFWARRYRSQPDLPFIFIGGVVAAFIGAKIAFLLGEGWTHLGHDDTWLRLLTGKSVTGALLGGYAGVEIAKRAIGHREPTGDFFAIATPLSLAVGRIGCWVQGCCLGHACDTHAWYALTDHHGVARWPAVPVEITFNLVALAVILILRRSTAWRGQLFHLYLIAYGTFRFIHEFARATPRIGDTPISGYQLIAVAIVVLGVVRFGQRRRALSRA